MKRFVLTIAMAAISVAAFAQEYSWEAAAMDGSRTGCTSPSENNVRETLGRFKGSKYIAPNGKVFRKNTSTAKVARIVLDAQPQMARVKEVVATSPEAMYSEYPESALSNWFVDLIMDGVGKISGKPVDIGIANFGGIRVDMPEGDVILDDLLSMFPFKNQVVYLEHKGSEIRKILESMAAGRFQVLGGVRVVAEDGKLVSVEIGGEPLDDSKVYGMATISFLLHGGDGLSLSDNAVSETIYDIDIIDVVLDFVRAETAAGRPLVSESDGRVIIR